MNLAPNSLTAENYGSGNPSNYYALQDYLNFVFVRTGNTIASFQMSTLGQTIESYNETLTTINNIYQYATNTDVELNMDGDVDTSTSNANISDYASIQAGLQDGYDDLTDLINSGTVTGDTLTYLEDVQTDIITYAGSSGDFSQTEYYDWYEDTNVQQNLENALAAVESIGLQQQEQLKQANYIYEQYVKGSSSLLSTIDLVFQTMATGMRN